jgi:S-adenosylmethionine synthetase
MASLQLSENSYLQTAESVTEGHPDKLCDQISDAILDAILEEDPLGRVACETVATTGLIIILGEITTSCYVDIPKIVRNTVRDVGYIDDEYGFNYKTCGVMVAITEQSLDIAAGVDIALEARESGDSGEIDLIGAGDQGIMVGYACNETENLMPLPISLAHQLTKNLAGLRQNNVLPYLRPDGKSQVVVEYENGKPKRVDSVTIAAQHDPEVSRQKIESDLRELLISESIPSNLLDGQTKYYVNASGRFVIGGPMGDAGLTGRKIIVDSYGPGYKHGGGAFSGKDPTKVDRSGAYAARYVAKNIVSAGLADRCEIRIAYVIGMSIPVSVEIETYGTETVKKDQIKRLVEKNFDLRPGAIIRDLDLRRPIYRQLAAYGHFGRDDLIVPWEKLDKADILRKQAAQGL